MNPSIHIIFNAVRDELMQTKTVTSIAESQSPTMVSGTAPAALAGPEKIKGLSTDFGVVNASYDYVTHWLQLRKAVIFQKIWNRYLIVNFNEAAVHFMNLRTLLERSNMVGAAYTISWCY